MVVGGVVVVCGFEVVGCGFEAVGVWIHPVVPMSELWSELYLDDGMVRT